MSVTDPPHGPHRVPRIECGACGHEHHIDAVTGEYQGCCSECSAFLRRPTDAEVRKFYHFMDWKSRHTDPALADKHPQTHEQ